MNYSALTRNKDRVFKALKELEDHSVIALEPLEVHIPKRFIERSLADIGDKVETIGVLGIVIPDVAYCCMYRVATVTLSPSNIREITLDGVRYVVLDFEKGDTVFNNIEVVKDEHLNYSYYMEFGYFARIPWYVDVTMAPKLFDYAGLITGKKVGTSPQVFRVLYGLSYRDPDNYEIAYRYGAGIKAGKKPHLVGLNNGSMLIDGTFNRLMGGYLADNTIAAILNPDTKVTDSEKVMKGSPE